MSSVARTGRRARTALWTDLPVAALLLAGWFTVAAGAVPHVIVGLLFVAWAVLHVATRPRLRARLGLAARASWPARRRLATWLTIGFAAVMTISGLAQWAGVVAMTPIHSTSCYRAAGQCSALQGGGEGPRWEGRQGSSSALTGTAGWSSSSGDEGFRDEDAQGGVEADAHLGGEVSDGCVDFGREPHRRGFV